jgi:molecular chaperone GrpE
MKKADSHVKKMEPAPAATSAVGTAATTVAAAAPNATAATAPAAEVTPEQLADLKARAAKADEHWDRLLRTAADFENFKKRAARERHEAAQSATAALVHKLLPVLDHLEMAQAAAAQNTQGDKLAALQDGIAMTQQQLKGILAETGLEDVDANGQAFDPMLHEAVSQLETTEAPEGQVVQQIRKGYKMRDRLLRPATVVVAKKPAAPPATPPAA